MNPETVRYHFPNQGQAILAIMRLLIDLSAPFTVTPLPDDAWIIEVKRETADAGAFVGLACELK